MHKFSGAVADHLSRKTVSHTQPSGSTSTFACGVFTLLERSRTGIKSFGYVFRSRADAPVFFLLLNEFKQSGAR